jgi:hypothetical protein
MDISETAGKIMSHAERRKAKKPVVIVTPAMKEQQRADLVELRKFMRMQKSNGSRGKMRKFMNEKRARDDDSDDDDDNFFSKKEARAIDQDAAPLKKSRKEAPAAAPAGTVPVPPKTAPRKKRIPAASGRKQTQGKPILGGDW